MANFLFPDPNQADETGLVCLGGRCDAPTLIEAYLRGIFPWPINPEFPITWFSPDPRGLIYTSKVHYPNSFLKSLKKCSYKITLNKSFEDVIDMCATIARPNQPGSWITKELKLGYIELHKLNHAYSIEVWNDSKLIGGLYGVKIGQFISGESMFSLHKDASKYALHYLLENLKRNQVEFLDTQMLTPLTTNWGGDYISRKKFLNHLKKIDWRKEINLQNEHLSQA